MIRSGEYDLKAQHKVAHAHIFLIELSEPIHILFSISQMNLNFEKKVEISQNNISGVNPIQFTLL